MEPPREMPIMKLLGIQLDGPPVPDAYTAVLVATPDTLNLNGVVHGAAIATLVDHAGGYGARRLLGRGGVTSDLHIRFLSAGRAGSVLTAESRVVRAGRSQIVMDVRVTDDDGRLIAVADLSLAVVEPPPSNS
ncbi:MAG: PaaI family thioesterase [Acidimicrobiia bacterium]